MYMSIYMYTYIWKRILELHKKWRQGADVELALCIGFHEINDDTTNMPCLILQDKPYVAEQSLTCNI